MSKKFFLRLLSWKVIASWQENMMIPRRKSVPGSNVFQKKIKGPFLLTLLNWQLEDQRVRFLNKRKFLGKRSNAAFEAVSSDNFNSLLFYQDPSLSVLRFRSNIQFPRRLRRTFGLSLCLVHEESLWYTVHGFKTTKILSKILWGSY